MAKHIVFDEDSYFQIKNQQFHCPGAKTSEKYLRKGSKVYIEGKLKTRKWDDKQGITRYSTEIVADVMQMLDKKVSDSPESFVSKTTEVKQAVEPSISSEMGEEIKGGDLPF